MATNANCWGDETEYDFNGLTAKLNQYLRLRTNPVAMKRFATEADLDAIPKNLMGQQCGAVVGLTARNEEFLDGKRFHGVWYGDLEDSAEHQREMSCAPHGDYEALVTSPLISGRIDNPDICLIYGTPGQMITLMNGLQYKNYKKYTFTCVGESSCSDSWGNALKTGEPSMSIPCYAERKFGGVQDDEMLIALPPKFLPQIVDGLAALSKNGLRYPIPNHGIDKSPMASINQSYG